MNRMKNYRFVILIMLLIMTGCGRSTGTTTIEDADKKSDIASEAQSADAAEMPDESKNIDNGRYKGEEIETESPDTNTTEQSVNSYFYFDLGMDNECVRKEVDSLTNEMGYEKHLELSMNGEPESRKKIFDIGRIVALAEKTTNGQELLIIKESYSEEKYPMTIYGYLIDWEESEKKAVPDTRDLSDYYEMALSCFVEDKDTTTFTFIPSESKADCKYSDKGRYKDVKYSVNSEYSTRSGTMILNEKDCPVWMNYYETSGDRSVIYIYDGDDLKCIIDYSGQIVGYDEQDEGACYGGMIYVYLLNCSDDNEMGLLSLQGCSYE